MKTPTATSETAVDSARTNASAAPESILCGLSGGVDSSVACYLLRERGHAVIGRTLLLHDSGASDEGEHAGSARDAADAAAFCARLGVPFGVIDRRRQFRQQITDEFFATYAAGQTPNPCVLCNAEIKFAALLEEADRVGFDRVATGHYAAIVAGPEPGRLALRRTNTGWKDQTYFLYRLSQEQLARIVFPLAELDKEQVREIARVAGLRAGDPSGDNGSALLADRPDSQDVCFAADGYIPFLRREALRRGADWMERLFTPGVVVNVDGKPIGSHRGLAWYTIGQRKGFAVQTTERLFVLGLLPDANQLIVGPYDQALRREIEIRDVVYSGRPAFAAGAAVHARVRSSARPSAAAVWPLATPGRLRVCFAQPVFAPAPGQSCVLYEGETVVAGGIIDR